MHIRHRAEARRVADHHAMTQIVDVFRQVDVITLGLHRDQRALKGFEHRKISGRARIAGIGREVENDDADLAIRPFRTPQGHELRDTRCQHLRAFDADMHPVALLVGRKDAEAMTPGTGLARRAGPAAEHDRAGCAIELGDRHHDGAFHRHQPSAGCAPGLERLELCRVCRNVRNIQSNQNFGGSLRVVIGRPPTSEKPVNETMASIRGRPSRMKYFSMAGRESSPLAKAGMTRMPRASRQAITPS